MPPTLATAIHTAANTVLLGKLGLGAAGILLAVAAGFWVEKAAVSDRQFNAAAWAGLVVTRLGLFVLMFGVLHQPAQSDVAGYYYPQMKIALAGGLPYRDYFSAYAPLFAYVGAAALRLWDSPLAIVSLTLVFEAVGFAAWRGVAHGFFNQRTARLATLLYVVNVLPLFNTAVEGQNQAWASCFLGFSTWLLLRRRWAASGTALGGALIFVKFLPLLFAPALWLHAARRTRWALGAGALPALVYGVCWWKHLNVLQPLLFEGKQTTCGCLPFLLGPLCPPGFPMVTFDVLLLFMLAAVLGLAARRDPQGHPRRGVYLVALLLFVLLVLSKKAFTYYLVMAWFPVCLCTAAFSPRRAALGAGLLSAFGALALLEPSLWFRWFDRQAFGAILQGSLQSNSPDARIHLGIFVCCEIALLGAYIGYAIKTWTLYCSDDAGKEPARSTEPGPA